MYASTLPAAGADIVVGVADCRIGGPPYRTISTYALGSCIALTAWDWKTRAGGLLHLMLPDSSIDRALGNPFLYADTGVVELIRRLEAGGAAKNRLRCAIAGGANMMADSTAFEIGRRNHLAVRKACWSQGIFVDVEDVGGHESRSVRLDLENGRVELRTSAGIVRALVHAGSPVLPNLLPRKGSESYEHTAG